MVAPRLLKLCRALLSGQLSDSPVACLCVLGVVTATLLAWRLSGRIWLSLAVGAAGMVLTAWHVVKLLTRLRGALAGAEQEHAAMEQALRGAQKMEALGRLTVGLAHDFNNHLTVISSNMEMLAGRLDGGQERLLRHADAAMQGVRRAAILTGRLLSFSRQPAVEPEAVDVDRLVSSLSELLRRTLGERIRLEVRLSGAPWFIWADINQLENALLSLVVNARDQVPDGETLSIAVSNAALDAVFTAAHPMVLPGEYVQVAVSGPAQATRWEPADELASAELFMARAFVREAGGCLLRSDPGLGGLSLRLFLPRHVPASVAGVGTPRAVRGGMRILVVEDEAAIRSVCVETLRAIGYDVLEASDAMEAFRLIADQGGIDLLFTDLGLPGGVSGRALVDAARHVDPGMRVLFTTGYECADLPGRVGALLRKPFSPEQLAAKVRAVLATGQTTEPSETVQG